MFHTFNIENSPKSPYGSGGSTPTAKQPQRRHQISRACGWCRTYRIKCDTSIPCRNCTTKGRQCIAATGKEEFRTFRGAVKEIDRLNQRVKELEDQLRSLRSGSVKINSDDEGSDSETMPVSLMSLSKYPVHLDPLAEMGVNKKFYNWDVVSHQNPDSSSLTYGTSSSFYFMQQMTLYMEFALQVKPEDLRAACLHFSKRLHSNASPEIDISRRAGTGSLRAVGHDLSKSAEDDYLRLFWQSFNSAFPILDESEFRVHHESLWHTSRALRRASALVDIVLALCMQCRAALPASHPDYISSDDPRSEMAGLWWHRRSQEILAEELECPSLTTFQCHVLSVIWLSNAGLHNTAYSVMASGIRIGVVLGLHLEPSQHLSPSDRESRKRIWWIMYALEMKFAMELGRPLAVSCSQVTCTLPADEELAPDPGRQAALFTANYVKLILANRAVYITFYKKCASEVIKSGKESLYQDLKSLEECAKFLADRTVYLHTWQRHVPEVLHQQRKGSGKPFSTDDVELCFDNADRFTQARQSVLLEIYYHVLAMSLYRPFIIFSGKSITMHSTIEAHAISCAKHAIAVTKIIHQVCAETRYLKGWLEVWQWQWAAILSLLGYILAYPNGPATTECRAALDIATSVLDLHSKTAVADVIRNLVKKVDQLILSAKDVLDNETNPAPAYSAISQPPLAAGIGNDTGWDYDSFPSNFEEINDMPAGDSGFPFATEQFSTLEGVDAGGQSMFDFLNFENFEGLS